jgi:subtilisin
MKKQILVVIWGILVLALISISAVADPTPPKVFSIPRRATWGERIEVKFPPSLQITDYREANLRIRFKYRIFDMYQQVENIDIFENSLFFSIPENTWGGPQLFEVVDLNKNIIASGLVNVLGLSVSESFADGSLTDDIFVLSAGGKVPDFSEISGLRSEELPIDLEGNEEARTNACSGSLYKAKRYQTSGDRRSVLSVGATLEKFENVNPTPNDNKRVFDIDGVLAVDPRPIPATGPLEVQSQEEYLPINVLDATGLESKLDGSGTTVAILDSGISAIRDLRTNLDSNSSNKFLVESPFSAFVDEYQKNSFGHGTASAALIAGDEFGLVSGVSIISIKTCDRDGKCPFEAVIQGMCSVINYAETHPERQTILNLSLGDDTPSEIMYTILKEALETEVSVGKSKHPLLLVTASAGNRWKQRDERNGQLLHYPAAFTSKEEGLPTRSGNTRRLDRISRIRDLISVGAVGISAQTGDFVVSDFSNRGDFIDLVAPGQQVQSFTPSGGLEFYTGTSFSAPIVAGALAALSRENLPRAADFKARLLSLVTPRSTLLDQRDFGAGVLNLQSLNPR